MAETASKPFILTRTFDAPRALVWKAWTDRAELAKWFGPKGVTIVHSKMDFRVGGTYHYGMQTPDGKVMWGKWTLREIVPQERLVVIVSFSDENMGVTRHPMAPEWPLQTLSRTTFTEKDGKTTLSVEWSAYEATEAERKVFDASHAGMNAGWGGTMQQLDEYLAATQGKKA